MTAPPIAPPSTVVGAGWLGRALATRLGVEPVPGRSFGTDDIVPETSVYVATGRPSLPVTARGGLAGALRSELGRLRTVLDACTSARRVVVLGSSDVAGLAPEVRGHTPQAPVTPYGQVKAALEDECRLRAEAGLPVTCVRLAPVHGPGKARTLRLLAFSRQPVVPMLAGGHHSTGFILLDDAMRALLWLGENPSPAVVSVGGSHTPLRALVAALARAQGCNGRIVTVPAPAPIVRRVASLPLPSTLHWLLRLSLPRSVEMEVPVPVTPLDEAARILVASC